jgi:hypothetical protein
MKTNYGYVVTGDVDTLTKQSTSYLRCRHKMLRYWVRSSESDVYVDQAKYQLFTLSSQDGTVLGAIVRVGCLH